VRKMSAEGRSADRSRRSFGGYTLRPRGWGLADIPWIRINTLPPCVGHYSWKRAVKLCDGNSEMRLMKGPTLQRLTGEIEKRRKMKWSSRLSDRRRVRA
jgi:hypothetical protein